MEKRIAASWCVRVERANRNRCSGLHDLPRAENSGIGCNKKTARFLARLGTRIASEAKQFFVIPGCALSGADPEFSIMHRSGFRVRAKTRAPE
jgi:hypothetical protein